VSCCEEISRLITQVGLYQNKILSYYMTHIVREKIFLANMDDETNNTFKTILSKC